ncbi:MAG TPA: glutaredoxin family protein [Candidatus Nanoarchaeia archaeon]|nr:glutaredoxin family protein [Candidatus Nanoarchaeia archaeon]
MPKVIVYSTPTCPWCHRAKEFLKEHNIKFEEVDVSKDEKAMQGMIKKSGQMGVPVIEINGKIVVGYDKDEISRLLKI